MTSILIVRPKKTVLLYGSRFGHFLSNTEYFLQHQNTINGDIHSNMYITINEKLDSLGLLKLIEKSYGIQIKTGMEALGLYWATILLRNQVIDISPLSEPIAVPFYSQCAAYIKKRQTCRPHITLSFRSGNYAQHMQGAMEATTWRDTPALTLHKSLENILDLGYDIHLINRCLNPKEILSYGVKDKTNLEMEERWGLIASASFHIGTCTGIDLCAMFSRTPICLLNSFFGCSLNSSVFTGDYVGFTLPMPLFYSPEGRFCNPHEQIELLQRIELECNQSAVNHPMLMRNEYSYIPNSEKSVFDAISELIMYVDKGFGPTKEQKAFWMNYPKKWTNVRYPDVVFHSDSYCTKLRISQNYLTSFSTM
jgi:hypothetical protein